MPQIISNPMRTIFSARKSLLTYSFLLLTATIFVSCSAARNTRKWFRHGNWYNGMSLTPHQTVNRKEFETQYTKNKELWDKAFAFLKQTDFSQLAPGKYPLDGDKLYASVTVGPMRDFEKTKWESHRKVIDLQYTAKGKEKMGVAPVTKAKLITPYDQKKDVANYEAEGKYYLSDPSAFFLFFPGDAHRPNIKVNEDDSVKKVVIKIRYTE